jgi:hypothetical protein
VVGILDSISYYLILGVPFVVYLGLIAITLFFVTGILMIVPKKKSPSLFNWHKRIALVALFFGFIHGLLGVLLYI